MRLPPISALAVPFFLTLSACAPSAPAVDLAGEAETLRQRDADFSNAAAAGDTEALLAFYAPDAVMMMDNAPAAHGSAAVREMFAGMLSMPGFGISWEVGDVVVAQGGDMAVTTGRYTMTMQGPAGPTEDRGKYLTVWKKVSGTWLVTHDIANSDVPLPEGSAGEMTAH